MKDLSTGNPFSLQSPAVLRDGRLTARSAEPHAFIYCFIHNNVAWATVLVPDDAGIPIRLV